MLQFVCKIETQQIVRHVRGFHWTCPLWMWHRQTDQELFTMLFELSVCTPKQANAATQYTTLTLQSPPGVSLNFTLMLMQAVSVFAVHLTNKLTSLMAMKEVIHLYNTAFHLNICPDLRSGGIVYSSRLS